MRDSATIEQRLRKLLADHRYESSVGRGLRGLMQHHIDALVVVLMPFIHEEIDRVG